MKTSRMRVSSLAFALLVAAGCGKAPPVDAAAPSPLAADKAGDANGKTDREFNATLTYGKTTYRGCADAVK